MSTFPVYLDLPGFFATAPSIETNSLIGGNTTLQGGATNIGGGVLGYAAGVTSLGAGSVTGFGTPTTSVPVEAWLLDGAISETVYITNIASTTLTLQSPTAAAHANGVCIASSGSQGSLAEAIVAASREVENICQQEFDGGTELDANPASLYATSRVEVYECPYGGAQIDIDQQLVIQPVHFPVRSVTSVTLQYGANSPITVDTSFLVLPNGARQIKIPQAQTVGQVPLPPPFYSYSWFPRDQSGYVTLTYVGGPCNGSSLAVVPADIRHATAMLVNDRLAFRANPLGVAMQRLGDTMQNFELRGDFGGKSLLWKDAKNRLRRYIRVL